MLTHRSRRPPRFRRSCCSLSRPSPSRLTYRVAEVAEMLGVSERTAWRWVEEGRLRPQRIGRTTLVPADQVTQLLRQGEQGGSQATNPEVDQLAREMLG